MSVVGFYWWLYNDNNKILLKSLYKIEFMKSYGNFNILKDFINFLVMFYITKT